jgi:hypothetical protein
MNYRRVGILLSLILGLSACAETPADTLPASSIAFAEEDGVTETTAADGGDDSAASSSDDDTSAEPEEAPMATRDDAVRFIAAVEKSIAGTTNEGIVYESPDVFLAIAQGFCDGLRDGQSVDELASDYLAEFSDGITEASADDVLLIGSVLGAGVETLCEDQSYKI